MNRIQQIQALIDHAPVSAIRAVAIGSGSYVILPLVADRPIYDVARGALTFPGSETTREFSPDAVRSVIGEFPEIRRYSAAELPEGITVV